MSKLRVGFIGAGGMADAHLKGLADANLFPDVEIAAFCDVVLERAKAQCDKYVTSENTPQAFSSPFEMVADAGLDACYVLLPPFAHGDAERACIQGNVPFLVEKPIGKDLGLLRELNAEISAKNLLTAAGYMNRYQPSVQRAKEAFNSDVPVLAYGGWLGGPPTSDNEYMANSLIGKWWVQKHLSGGQMVEQVTHTIDLVRYFLGDAVEVFAHTTTAFNKNLPNLMEGYSIDDAMTTTIKFESGALATILSSAATPVGGNVSLDILGMKSAVKFSGWGHEATIIRADGETETVESSADIFPVEDRAFLDAVKTGDASKVRTNYADAVKTAHLAIAANESAASGKAVFLTE